MSERSDGEEGRGGEKDAAPAQRRQSGFDDLEKLPDEALRSLAAKAQEIMAAREKEKRAAALREIQRLAKEHQIKIEVKEPAKKRGRPVKAKEGG